MTEKSPVVNSEEERLLQELKEDFLKEALAFLEECDEAFLKLEHSQSRDEELKHIFRVFHSLKGVGMSVGFDDIAALAHHAEDLLAVLRINPNKLTEKIQSLLLEVGDSLKSRIRDLQGDKPKEWSIKSLTERLANALSGLKNEEAHTESVPQFDFEYIAPLEPPPQVVQKVSTIKVDVEKVESLLDLVGELMVIKSQIGHHDALQRCDDRDLHALFGLLDKTVRELQDRALGMRMVPLKSMFLKVQRAVRDLSIKLEKSIDFIMDGESTELDRRIIEALADPLIHIVRNALDHGIERPDERAQTSKPAKATVSLTAKSLSGKVVIEIRDDGRGISRKNVFSKAVSRGLVSPATNIDDLSPEQIYAFLFKAGFSTAESISDVSGRGIGLDVAKSNVEKLGGTISIESKEGDGTCFSLSFPLTTAITDGLMIGLNKSSYILPIGYVHEIFKIENNDLIQVEDGKNFIDVRGEMLPIYSLGRLLFGDANSFNSKTAIVVEHRNKRISLSCDVVMGQTQVVQKSLNSVFENLPSIAGGAILGNGNVALILDIEKICQIALFSESGAV